jgi:isoquinoline 1-oxidoreductase subunit alpha
MISLFVNGKKHAIDASPDTPLLWVLRDKLGLMGTKFGCGIAMCGACTVHIDGQPQLSCQVSVKDAQGKKITTIEGIPDSHPVKKAWIEDDVPQCGYCQPGQIMSAIALLQTNPKPNDNDINDAMAGNICRCGTYQRIRRAIHRAVSNTAKGGKP